MTTRDILRQRLTNQQLTQTRFNTPTEVVAWLGAVQAQDYAGAKWSLGLRLQGIVEQDIDQAFNDGTILRTHVMRPTWHFVTPSDIRWMLSLTAPRVDRLMATYYRKLELDDAFFAKSNVALTKALEDNKQLTRPELGEYLKKAGVDPKSLFRLGFIVFRAELDGIVCSGGRRGKQFTYALLEERVPKAKTLTREEALAELTKRYFISHGPATLKDFSWWSGLTMTDAKQGIEMNKSLTEEVVDGKTYWLHKSLALSKDTPPPTYLLPTYDEYTIAYSDRRILLHPSAKNITYENGFYASIAMNGYITGSWRRIFQKGKVVIQTKPFVKFNKTETQSLEEAAQHYGIFLNLPITITS